MHLLFQTEPAFPDGFTYSPGFITVEEETRLHKEILKTELHNFNFQGFKANRKVASFGYDYSFDSGSLTKGKEIPAGFHFVMEKVGQYLTLPAEQFAELLVTEYAPGTVINWHRDAPPFDIIAGISLLADCSFRLRPHDKAKQGRGSVITFPVERRSLYIIRGPSRTDWQHSIAPVKQTRLSITLRTLR